MIYHVNYFHQMEHSLNLIGTHNNIHFFLSILSVDAKWASENSKDNDETHVIIRLNNSYYLFQIIMCKLDKISVTTIFKYFKRGKDVLNNQIIDLHEFNHDYNYKIHNITSLEWIICTGMITAII